GVRCAVIGVALRLPPVARRAAGTISGIGIGYPRRKGDHPLAGRRMPDLALADGRRLYEALRSGHFVLVGDAPEGWAGRVDAVAPAQPARRAILVRPDAYIAWASEDGSWAGTRARPARRRSSAVEEALTRWCGRVGLLR